MTRTFLIILSTVVHMIQMSDLNESFIATNNWKVIQKGKFNLLYFFWMS